MKLLTKHQLILLLLTTFLFHSTKTQTCKFEDYCMKCTDAVCNWCHPDNTFKIPAKIGSLSSATDCKEDLSTIAAEAQTQYCWIYNPKGPGERYSNMNVTNLGFGERCLLCNEKLYLSYNQNTYEEFCTDTSVIYPNWGTNTSACAKIDNCLQTICYTGTVEGATYCAMCDTEGIPVPGTVSPDGVDLTRIVNCSASVGMIVNCMYHGYGQI